VKLACIVKENLPEEIAAFEKGYWSGGEMWLDEKQEFFSAVGGGKPVKHTMAGFLLGLANPWSRLNKNLKSVPSSVEQNLVGEGFVSGGIYVVRKGSGEAELSFSETNLGDTAAVDDVLKAAERCASGDRI